ncbi:MAG: tyrosine--tRNA ligase [Porticoccaceae bacterium]|jgi:tyrosyl-tRNA synthetase|nr:tyrosine--tRNA ligase [Porticoccaceae bacterium]
MDLSGKKLVMQLEQRGLIAQYSGDENLAAHLDVSRTLYCGFDPTADSLHIGSLVPLLMLKRFQEAGHRPIILVGGSTGLIGDPSFKAEERKLNSPEIVAGWVEKIRHQTSQFVDFDENLPNGAIIVNNLDWTAGIDVLDFLRDVGKHFSINSMIQKESVKQRLQRDGGGISFTEFSYSLLQSLDFAELNRRYNCTLQIGGSDQWGNIVGGIDLTRRQNQSQCFGLTSPLITKADGSKFGKTESGTVWLNAGKTSPYSFYQFWLNVADEDVYKFLRYFTFLSLEGIEDIERSDRDSDKKPEAQRILAREATELVHGKLGVEAALRISDALFSGDPNKLSKKDFEQMCQDGISSSSVDEEGLLQKPLTQILTDCGMVKAGREVKDALGRHSVFVNGIPQGNSDNMKAREIFSKEKALHGRFFLVRLGKKKYHLFERA